MQAAVGHGEHLLVFCAPAQIPVILSQSRVTEKLTTNIMASTLWLCVYICYLCKYTKEEIIYSKLVSNRRQAITS